MSADLPVEGAPHSWLWFNGVLASSSLVSYTATVAILVWQGAGHQLDCGTAIVAGLMLLPVVHVVAWGLANLVYVGLGLVPAGWRSGGRQLLTVGYAACTALYPLGMLLVRR